MTEGPYESTMLDVCCEAQRSRTKYGPYASAHEAMGVLDEEYMELRRAIHANDADAIHAEALQISAVAMRLCEEIGNVEAMRERSGCA